MSPSKPPLVLFHLFARRLTGTATDDGQRFVVHAGTEAYAHPSTIQTQAYAARRAALVETGTLAPHPSDPNKLVFTTDVVFGSSGEAATVVCGRQSNGAQTWRTADGQRPARRHTYKGFRHQLPALAKRLRTMADTLHIEGDPLSMAWTAHFRALAQSAEAKAAPPQPHAAAPPQPPIAAPSPAPPEGSPPNISLQSLAAVLERLQAHGVSINPETFLATAIQRYANDIETAASLLGASTERRANATSEQTAHHPQE